MRAVRVLIVVGMLWINVELPYIYSKHWRISSTQKSRDWYFKFFFFGRVVCLIKHCSDEVLYTPPQMDELGGRPFSGMSSFGLLTTFHWTIYLGPSRRTQTGRRKRPDPWTSPQTYIGAYGFEHRPPPHQGTFDVVTMSGYHLGYPDSSGKIINLHKNIPRWLIGYIYRPHGDISTTISSPPSFIESTWKPDRRCSGQD